MSATIPPDGAASGELLSEPLPRMIGGRPRMPSDLGKAAWLFLAPALLLIFIFFFLPVLASLVLSVTDFDIYAIANPPTTRFVGLANYAKLLHTPEFWTALKNTFYFELSHVTPLEPRREERRENRGLSRVDGFTSYNDEFHGRSIAERVSF